MKIIFVVVLFGLCALAAALPKQLLDTDDADVDVDAPSVEWDYYKKIHKRHHKDHVTERKFKKRFLKRLDRIKKHNELYKSGKVSYKRTVNKFSDIDHKEFCAKHNGFVSEMVEPNTAKRDNRSRFFRSKLPDHVDWRERGVDFPIQDQETCASCWSFASVAAIEAHEVIKNGRKIELSEQNLVDCAKSIYNVGCMGGHMIHAFNYTRDVQGLSLRMYYPYENGKGSCRYKPVFNAKTYSISYRRLPKGDEEALKEAVATVGPVAAAIDANLESLVEYSGGIYYDEECSSTAINHAILVVGYGTENGQDYWLIKNSLGKYWGEKGYLKLARNKNNHCGVATDPVYPLIKSPVSHRF